MWSALQGLLFVSALTAASVSDIRTRTIPYSTCILLAVVGLIQFSLANFMGLVLAVPFFLASGYGRGGAGDTMLVTAASLTLGLYAGMAGMAFAMILFLLFAGCDRLVRRIQKKTEWPVSYPLAPFLSIGFIAAYFIR